jgi:hypothetical protein
MKNIVLHKFVFLVLAVALMQPSIACSQATNHIVYCHGIFASNGELDALATEMANEGITGSILMEDYASLGFYEGIVTQAQNIETDIAHEWGSSPALLVGHSMGGVEIRSVAQQFPTTTMGYVTVDAPNAGAYFASGPARGAYVSDCAYDRGQIQRQTIGVLGTLTGIVEQVIGYSLEFVSDFGQAVNANIQDLVPNSTFMNNLAVPGCVTEVAGFGDHRCAVWSSCVTPRLPAWNSTNIQSDQQSFLNSISYCQSQAHSYDQTANDMKSSINWRHPWNAYKWPAIIYDRSRAGDYTAAANGYTDMNASWETHTMGGLDGDSFISVLSQKYILIPSEQHIFEVGTDNSKTDQVNHGGAVFGVSNGFAQIHAAMVAAGAN